MKYLRLVILLLISYSLCAQAQTSYIVRLKKNIKIIDNSTLSMLNIKPVFANINAKNDNRTLSVAQSSALEALSRYYSVTLDNVQLKSLIQSEMIESIEPNHKYKPEIIENPDDVEYPKQWGMTTNNVPKAWEIATGKGMIVGVMDTGLDYNHPDLKSSVFINSAEDANDNGTFEPWSSKQKVNDIYGDFNGIDDDGNGYVDDVIGYDFVDQTIANLGDWSEADPDPYDENNHGTYTSGVIAAQTNNGIGIAGVARDAKILCVRVMDATGNGESDDIAAGIVYAANAGANVLNMSFGDYFDSPVMHDALKYAYSKGCFLVASAGNDNSSELHYPSDYEECLSVGGENKRGSRWGSSNWGNRLGVLAPSDSVFTTVPNKSYGYKNGTSLAAPFVSAAAVLLMGSNSTITNKDIGGILKATATQMSGVSATLQGAGKLNIYSALSNNSPAECSFDYPKDGDAIDYGVKSVAFVGTAAAPLFKYYIVSILNEDESAIWTSDTVDTQVKNDNLALWIGMNSADTVAIARLQIMLENGNIIEKRIKLRILRQNEKLALSDVQIRLPYFEDRPVVAISANSSIACPFYIRLSKKGSNEFKIYTENEQLSREHLIIIDDKLAPGVEYTAEIYGVFNSIDTAMLKQEFIFPTEYFSTKEMTQEIQTIDRMTYMSPISADLKSDGNKYLLVNDLTGLTVNDAYVYKYNKANKSFSITDSINSVQIPIGTGDVDGDGKKEIVVTYGGAGMGKTIIYRLSDAEGKVFGDKIYESSSTGVFWADAVKDMDGDGKSEIIGRNDTCFFVLGYKDGVFKIIDLALPNADYIKHSTVRTSAVGDFDSDGDMELCHTNTLGHIFVYGYKNSKLSLEYADTASINEVNMMIAGGDINADGVQDIITSYPGVIPPRVDIYDRLWTINAISYASVSGYKSLGQVEFFGVRVGATSLKVFYRDGLSVGNIDGENGDEIAVSAMPYIYIMKWSNANNKFIPIKSFNSTFANAVNFNDFDGDGKTEAAFCSFSGTEIYEYNSAFQLDNPCITISNAVDDSTAYIEWNSIGVNSTYKVSAIDLDSFNGTSYKMVSIDDIPVTKINFSGLSKHHHYMFNVRAKSGGEFITGESNNQEVYISNPFEYKSVELSPDNQSIKIKYDGIMRLNKALVSDFEVYDSSVPYRKIPVASVQQSGDNAILLSFKSSVIASDYILKVKSFATYFGNTAKSFETAFTAEEVKPDELYLKNLTMYSKTYMVLEFSEDIDTSAINISNYIVKPYGRIVSMGVVPGEPTKIGLNMLYGSNIAPLGKNYTITAGEAITAISGNKMTQSAGNTLGFVMSAEDNQKSFVYPNPVKLSDLKDVYIGGLTSRADIEIMTIDGIVLRHLSETDGNGGVEWDAKNDDGLLLNPGIYLFKVYDKSGSTKFDELHKFAIVP